ncbi:HAD family hydrolase, partial [Clavibacter michiganensis]|uniref:HAD family hydrolase n=1 Tax=Clavibacter michiganensis TaxID=28447 RepID=UPI0034169639
MARTTGTWRPPGPGASRSSPASRWRTWRTSPTTSTSGTRRRWSGRLEGEFLHGALKAAAARGLLTGTGADPAACWAYSDSRHDIPLLTLVGHPVVVNPDQGLAAHARDSGWPSMRLHARASATPAGACAARPHRRTDPP